MVKISNVELDANANVIWQMNEKTFFLLKRKKIISKIKV